jgi:hypothetical protein
MLCLQNPRLDASKGAVYEGIAQVLRMPFFIELELRLALRVRLAVALFGLNAGKLAGLISLLPFDWGFANVRCRSQATRAKISAKSGPKAVRVQRQYVSMTSGSPRRGTSGRARLFRRTTIQRCCRAHGEACGLLLSHGRTCPNTLGSAFVGAQNQAG